MADIYTPGSVRAADEAFDGLPVQVPPEFTLLPPIGSDVNVANQGFPPPPPGSQALPVPSFVSVSAVPFVQPSFSQGVATPQVPDNDIADQVLTNPLKTQEFIVTENGNFATNNNTADVQGFLLAGNAVQQGPNPADETTVWQMNLTDLNGNPITLSSFGVDFTQLFMSFPANAPANAPENIPSRPITAFNDPNTIVVPVLDSFGNSLAQPTNGQRVTIGILRQGASLTLSTIDEIDVTISPSPPVAVTTPATGAPSLGNVAASSGVLTPFIGSGQQLPPFIGTFEVENQVPLGKGLPTNVFV